MVFFFYHFIKVDKFAPQLFSQSSSGSGFSASHIPDKIDSHNWINLYKPKIKLQIIDYKLQINLNEKLKLSGFWFKELC